MLEISNLSKTLSSSTADKKLVLDNVSLTINDDDFITVIGSNGAGKSTLLNSIAGLFLPDSGTIKIDGNDITKLPEHKRAKYFGRVFQDPLKGTAANMSIVENLSIAARRGKIRSLKWGILNKEKEEYRKMLESFDLGLETRLDNKIGLLSGGQRQAVTLLMATINKPKLLLLDEHTASLDPKTSKKVLTLTNKIVKENHIPTLMITHNMQDAIDYGNRLIMMHNGQIVLDLNSKEKSNLTVKELIQKFEDAVKEELIEDKMMLAN